MSEDLASTIVDIHVISTFQRATKKESCKVVIHLILFSELGVVSGFSKVKMKDVLEELGFVNFGEG